MTSTFEFDGASFILVAPLVGGRGLPGTTAWAVLADVFADVLADVFAFFFVFVVFVLVFAFDAIRSPSSTRP